MPHYLLVLLTKNFLTDNTTAEFYCDDKYYFSVWVDLAGILGQSASVLSVQPENLKIIAPALVFT
jgi:hypothetical protein